MKPKVYLDNNVYNRPFDDQTQLRIRLEASAFEAILRLAEEKKIVLVKSVVSEYENALNPFAERKEKVASYFLLASLSVDIDEGVRKTAKELQNLNLLAIDILHLSCAKRVGADYFVTCDDKILKKEEKLAKSLNLQVLSPVEFTAKEVK